MIFNKVKNENNAKVGCGTERVNKQMKKQNFREHEKLRKICTFHTPLRAFMWHSENFFGYATLGAGSTFRCTIACPISACQKAPTRMHFFFCRSLRGSMWWKYFYSQCQIKSCRRRHRGLIAFFMPITLKSVWLGTSTSFVNENVFSCRQTIRIVLLPSTSKK